MKKIHSFPEQLQHLRSLKVLEAECVSRGLLSLPRSPQWSCIMLGDPSHTTLLYTDSSSCAVSGEFGVFFWLKLLEKKKKP